MMIVEGLGWPRIPLPWTARSRQQDDPDSGSASEAQDEAEARGAAPASADGAVTSGSDVTLRVIVYICTSREAL